MKRIITIFSVLIISLALALLHPLLVGPEDRVKERILPEDALRTPADPTSQTKTKPFEGFPFNTERDIILGFDQTFAEQLTEREWKDQQLDWLLFVVISDSGLDALAQTEVLDDLAISRHGYLKPVSNFEYGTTRARYIGKDQVVAILPKNISEKERIDLLAHIADEQRKNLGKIPKTILPFAYTLADDPRRATLTRLENVPTEAKLFSEEGGYFTTIVKTRADLETFLEKTDDVTYARRLSDGVELGGRHLLSRPYRSVDLEDVAAIWQSEQFISESLENGTLRGNDHSGFSLDPQYDHARLIKEARFLQELFDGAVEQGGMSSKDREILELRIASGDLDPVLRIKNSFLEDEDPSLQLFGRLFEYELDQYRFQAARYDGKLQGTKVGMNLFYTDLLAKLWMMDFENSAPEKHIDDFRAQIGTTMSAVFEEDQKANSRTRVWFGPDDSGFELSKDESTLFFGRHTTRIFAASTTELKDGQEGEPSASSETFLSWWDQHYEEVSQYEPEYERLDQILKWNGIVTWLFYEGEQHLLGHLEEVDVERGLWFPEWISQNKELTFQNWQNIEFYELGHAGTQTEAMQILRAERIINSEDPLVEQMVRTISGGISGFDRARFLERSAAPRVKTVRSRRPGRWTDTENPGVLRAKDGRSLRVKPGNRRDAQAISAPRPVAKLRNMNGEIRRANYTRNLKQQGRSLEIEAKLGKEATGRLSINQTTNGFHAAFSSHGLSQAFNMARRISRFEDLPSALAKEPHVEMFMPWAQGDFAVKLRDGGWFRVQPQAKPTVDLPPGWAARVSHPEQGKQNLLVAELPPQEVSSFLKAGEWVQIKAPRGGKMEPMHLEPTRGPPKNGFKKIEGETGIQVDAQNKILLIDPKKNVPWQKVRQMRERLSNNHAPIPPPPTGGNLESGGKDPGKRFVDPLVERNRRKMIDAYLVDPQTSKLELQNNLLYDIELSRKLAKEKHLIDGQLQLEQAIGRFGPRPELQLQKALFEIQQGRQQHVVEILKQGENQALALPYQELSTFLKAGRDTRSASRAIEYTQAKHFENQSAQKLTETTPVFDGNKVDFSTQWKGTEGRILKANEWGAMIDRSKKIYAEEALYESASLAFRDPALPLHQSLDPLLSQGKAILIELPEGPIGHFVPGRVKTSGISKNISDLWTNTPPGKIFPYSGGQQPPGPVFNPAPSGSKTVALQTLRLLTLTDDDEDDEEKLRKRLERQMAPKPVYLLVARPQPETVAKR